MEVVFFYEIFIVNSSPRKNNNTIQLLNKAAEGIKDMLKNKNDDLKIERLDLYD